MKKKTSISAAPEQNGSEPPKHKNIVDRIIHFFSLITIEPSLLVHMTASFMGNLLLKNLLLYKACHVNLGYNETICEALVDKAIKNKTLSGQLEDEAQEITAAIGVWNSVLDNAFPVLFVLFLGAWSDVYGRKLPYVLSILGYVVRYALLILSVYFTSWNAELTAALSSIPVAITGSRTAISMVIYSYITDTTSIRERTVRVGVATAVRTFGKSLGSAVGGQMSKSGMGYYAIFGVSGGLDLIGLLYAMFFLKNVRDPNITRSKSTCVQLKHIFNFRNITDTVVAFFRKRERGDRARLFLLVIALMCTMAPMQAEETKLYEYTRKKSGLGWDAGEYGYYNTYRMIIAFVGGITSVGLLSKWLKLSDALIGIFSCISQIASSFMYAYAQSDIMMYLAPVVDILNGTMIIASRSMISKIIPRHETGKVNSFVATIDSITPLISSPLYNQLYSSTLETFVGAFFLLSAAVTVPPLIIFVFLGCFWIRDDYRKPSIQPSDERSETGSQDSDEVMRRGSYIASETGVVP